MSIEPLSGVAGAGAPEAAHFQWSWTIAPAGIIEGDRQAGDRRVRGGRGADPREPGGAAVQVDLLDWSGR